MSNEDRISSLYLIYEDTEKEMKERYLGQMKANLVVYSELPRKNFGFGLFTLERNAVLEKKIRLEK